MSWSKVVSVIKAGFLLLPHLPAAIRTLEDIIPGEGRGEQKLRMLREMLEDLISALDVGIDLEYIWPLISKWVERIVGKMNEEDTWDNV